MKEKSYSNVMFVTTAVLIRDMLHQFIKERIHSNATFVTTAVLKSVA